jgi:serine/threonine protein kinase
VHDAGRGADGAPFYAMKLVGGRPLAEVAAAARTIGQRLALVPTVLSVADALAYAHSQGVIHRDLKPHNVLVGEFGEVVVIDWGLAKDLRAPVDGDLDAAPATPSLVGRADTLPPNVDDGAPPAAAGTGGRAGLHPRSQASLSATVGGAVLGTPAYMAPEQAAGDPVDERADVYALGAMLYEVLAGIGPHHGKTIDDVLRNVVSGRIKPLADRAISRRSSARRWRASRRRATAARASWPRTCGATSPGSSSPSTSTAGASGRGGGCAATARPSRSRRSPPRCSRSSPPSRSSAWSPSATRRARRGGSPRSVRARRARRRTASARAATSC